MFIETRNPTTEEVIKRYETMSNEQVKTIIHNAHSAFHTWQDLSIASRAEYLYKVASLLRQQKDQFAKLITKEMGKPINFATSEIEKCAWVCEYYAEHGEKLLAPRKIQTEYQSSYVCYQPLGVIFAVMPWNFPFWQVFRFAAPNLMAGNVAILRSAEITTGSGLAIEQLFREANVPPHVFSTVITGHETSEFIIKHDLIRGVTLTGSPGAGRAIASQAGSVLKKVVLELGGNDPYLILNDADLSEAAKICVRSRLANSGQVCIAAKRIIVDTAVYDRFEQLVLEELKQYTMGDPLNANTHLGPLARSDLRENVHRQVTENVKQGAKLLAGGQIPNQTGFFYPATVLSHVQSGMLAMQEEIFGPVITLIPAKNLEEAISLANDSSYGLAASVFTQNHQLGEEIAAKRLRAGTCNVNSLVASDPRLPFGGIKDSGFGRELGMEGMHEFMNIKTVCIR